MNSDNSDQAAQRPQPDDEGFLEPTIPKPTPVAEVDTAPAPKGAKPAKTPKPPVVKKEDDEADEPQPEVKVAQEPTNHPGRDFLLAVNAAHGDLLKEYRPVVERIRALHVTATGECATWHRVLASDVEIREAAENMCGARTPEEFFQLRDDLLSIKATLADREVAALTRRTVEARVHDAMNPVLAAADELVERLKQDIQRRFAKARDEESRFFGGVASATGRTPHSQRFEALAVRLDEVIEGLAKRNTTGQRTPAFEPLVAFLEANQ